MKPFVRLAEAQSPDGSVLTLFRHDRDRVMHVNGVELMSTRRSNSESRLAQLVCAPLAGRPRVRVLIGGLGLGFTVRAALPLLLPDARVLVVELVREVIEWNRNPEFALAGSALADSRVDAQHGDVADALRDHPGEFDGIMLDVDNGAQPLTTRGNAQLYDDDGIRLAVAALRPGGRVAYWSADRDRGFVKALHRAGLTVDAERVRAHSSGGSTHMLYVARRSHERVAIAGPSLPEASSSP